MTHQPKTLALLISLIGASVPSGAHASTALIAPVATALDPTQWSGALAWQHENGVPTLTPLPQRLADEPVAQDSAAEEPVAQEPGTASVHPEPALRAVAVHAAPALESRPQRIRSLLKAFGSRLKAQPPADSVAALPVVAQPAAAARATTPSIVAKTGPQPAGAVRFAGGSAPPARSADVGSAHAERLLQSLSAVLDADLGGLSRDDVLARVADRFPAAVDAPSVAEPLVAAAAPKLTEQRTIVVASPADRVLRNLEEVLSRDHGAPAVAAEPHEIVVATQAEKVLATLLELSTARRAREVRVERPARDARNPAIATLQAASALQSSLPASEPLETAVHQAHVDIDLGLPPFADPVAQRSPAPSPFGTQQLAVAESSLDRVRGGFITGGLNISFGIERAVYVNGSLVTSTVLNVSDLGRITGGSGTAALDSGTLQLIQSGAGNLVSVGSISPTSVGTVVQNALDGQKIQNLTVINATVNSLGVLRGLNLQSSLRGAVIDSLRR